MTWDLFPVRLAGAGSGDSRTSGHLDQPPLETDCTEKLEGQMCFSWQDLSQWRYNQATLGSHQAHLARLQGLFCKTR